MFDKAKASALIKALIFEGKNVTDIRTSLKDMGAPSSFYSVLLKDGLISQWRTEKGINLSKVVFKSGDYSLSLVTGLIGGFGGEQKLPIKSFFKTEFCSYLILYKGDERLHCYSLFNICDRPEKTFNLSLKSVQASPEAFFDTVVKRALKSTRSTLDELNRIDKVL